MYQGHHWWLMSHHILHSQSVDEPQGVIVTMNSVHAPPYPPPHVQEPVVLTPALAAMVFNPLGQRLRIRQRLSAQVYVADCVSESSIASSNPTKQVVMKLERLHFLRGSKVPDSSSSTIGQELQAAQRLLACSSHCHVVRFVETHVAHNMALVVMEHCVDGDLFTYLVRSPHQRLSEPEALYKLRQIASGVQYLHHHNLAHRDLSLENILLQGGDCKICDFGLSTYADRLANDVVGKIQYAAPEVVQGDWYDPVRADLWSLGTILFVLLTGSPLVPFASLSCPEFRAFRVVGVRGVLCAWGLETQFQRATVELLTDLLEVDPQRRTPSATQLLQHDALSVTQPDHLTQTV